MRLAAHLLSFASPKESRQRKGDPAVCDPFASLRGSLGRGVGGVGRRTHFAAAQRRSDNCGQLDDEARASFGARATPSTPRPRRIQKGAKTTRAIAALGLNVGSASNRGTAHSREPVEALHPASTSSARTGGEELRHAKARVLRAGNTRPSAAMARIDRPLCPCREAQRVGCAWAPKDAQASCSDWPQLSERSAFGAK